MKKYSILLFFCLIFIPHQIEKAVIVLTGQSNMVRSASAVTAAFPNYEIINCARGGTSVIRWQRGQDLYENCLDLVGNKRVAGIFHFQGERDSYDPDVYRQWSALTLQFFKDFKQDLGKPNAQIVFAQLGKLPTDRDRPYWRNIQSQQTRLARNYPEYKMIRTYDITPYCPSQGPHWCDAGYVEIADRFKIKFLEP